MKKPRLVKHIERRSQPRYEPRFGAGRDKSDPLAQMIHDRRRAWQGGLVCAFNSADNGEILRLLNRWDERRRDPTKPRFSIYEDNGGHWCRVYDARGTWHPHPQRREGVFLARVPKAAAQELCDRLNAADERSGRMATDERK